jgi:hypothetical protein
MLYTTNISTDLITEPELDALLSTIRKTTGKVIQVQKSFEICTEDISITTMLDALKDALTGQSAKPLRGGRMPKLKIEPVKAKKNGEMTSHQVKILVTGEIMSRQQFNKQLAAGQFDNGVQIINAKNQWFKVLDGQLVKEPQP